MLEFFFPFLPRWCFYHRCGQRSRYRIPSAYKGQCKGKVNEDSFCLFGHARSEKISFRGLLLQKGTSVCISFTSLYRYCWPFVVPLFACPPLDSFSSRSFVRIPRLESLKCAYSLGRPVNIVSQACSRWFCGSCVGLFFRAVPFIFYFYFLNSYFAVSDRTIRKLFWKVPQHSEKNVMTSNEFWFQATLSLIWELLYLLLLQFGYTIERERKSPCFRFCSYRHVSALSITSAGVPVNKTSTNYSHNSLSLYHHQVSIGRLFSSLLCAYCEYAFPAFVSL